MDWNSRFKPAWLLRPTTLGSSDVFNTMLVQERCTSSAATISAPPVVPLNLRKVRHELPDEDIRRVALCRLRTAVARSQCIPAGMFAMHQYCVLCHKEILLPVIPSAQETVVASLALSSVPGKGHTAPPNHIKGLKQPTSRILGEGYCYRFFSIQQSTY